MRPRGTRRATAACALAALAVAAAGCGSDEPDYRNAPRPPSPITVTAAIDHNRIRVSPTTFGAGPIEIIVSNQSGATQRITFETDEIAGSRPGLRASAGPVGPADTATIQASPRKGTYRLSVRDRAVRPARIVVGGPRRSAQDELLQP